MPEIKPPGVYKPEYAVVANTITEADTAVAAFIGYTQKADNVDGSVCNRPWLISSLAEFERVFGAAPTPHFSIEEKPSTAGEKPAFSLDGRDYWVHQSEGKAGGRYLLYYGIQLFFLNGGSTCQVVSVGNYDEDVSAEALTGGLDALAGEQEPAMVIIPDAVLLDDPACQAVQRACLRHCGETKSRFALLDIRSGDRNRNHPDGDCIERFRAGIGDTYLSYGAVYYPWLNTTLAAETDIGHRNIANPDTLATLLHRERTLDGARSRKSTGFPRARGGLSSKPLFDEADALFGKGGFSDEAIATSPLYAALLRACRARLAVLPPAAALAGVYARMDGERGVWKAPANIALHGVESPAVAINDQQQADLNTPKDSKAVNAIRTFAGKGTLVWGARTLAGNDNEWRYVSVRRTAIMFENTILRACQRHRSRPNDAQTWTLVKHEIEHFLTGIWRRGGLMGATPKEAFAVLIGTGSTMTAADVASGLMVVNVMVAMTQPAEFIVLSIKLRMEQAQS
ncbi:MAG: phage tail sheath C-terminal domain-containing protein [Porticoccaceae bacterium]